MYEMTRKEIIGEKNERSKILRDMDGKTRVTKDYVETLHVSDSITNRDSFNPYSTAYFVVCKIMNRNLYKECNCMVMHSCHLRSVQFWHFH